MEYPSVIASPPPGFTFFCIAPLDPPRRACRRVHMEFNVVWQIHSCISFRGGTPRPQLFVCTFPNLTSSNPLENIHLYAAIAVWEVAIPRRLVLQSKCLCCPNGAIETMEHVFSEGQCATAVWNYFASMCGLTQVGSSLRARVVAWWLSPPRAEKRQLLFTIMPSFICWHIWRARNKAVFEGTRMQLANICPAVISDITSGLENHFNIKLGWVSFPQLYDWSGQQGGGIRVEIVRWRAKEMGCLTLNTDGCSKGNPGWSGGGGVLRDSLGRPIMAFSAFFGKRLSLHAEALALLTGLQCVEKGFTNVEIQSDS
ncbi:uncharacterized protein [Coffea arabica]|uniref:RNase H type-1 domain-containing protein n=1 Tax=Coffea arabica TaxID=13443 RepID=A0ABM4U103_COFAR